MLYVWIDIETTGFDFHKCGICEIAGLVTRDDFVEINNFHRIIDNRNSYWEAGALRMHQASGLYREMEQGVTLLEAMQDLNKWTSIALDQFQNEMCYEKQGLGETANNIIYNAKLAGSSVHFDRRFLIRDWKGNFDSLFSHQELDVSSIGLVIKSTCGDEVANAFYETKAALKKADHRAMDDIRHSLSLLNYYREQGLISSRNCDFK